MFIYYGASGFRCDIGSKNGLKILFIVVGYKDFEFCIGSLFVKKYFYITLLQYGQLLVILIIVIFKVIKINNLKQFLKN